MKISSFLAKSLLMVTLLSTVLPVAATQPPTVPPRGHAYGYYMKDGGQVLFIYMEDTGERIIDLFNCWQGATYRIDASADLKTWVTLAVVAIQKDGTATYVDTAPMEHRYYTVTPVKK